MEMELWKHCCFRDYILMVEVTGVINDRWGHSPGIRRILLIEILLIVSSRRKEALHERRTQIMLYDTKVKLNNVVSHYRNDWHRKYLEIEKHQNSARLLRVDRMNRAQNLSTGSDLLQ